LEFRLFIAGMAMLLASIVASHLMTADVVSIMGAQVSDGAAKILTLGAQIGLGMQNVGALLYCVQSRRSTSTKRIAFFVVSQMLAGVLFWLSPAVG